MTGGGKGRWWVGRGKASSMAAGGGDGGGGVQRTLHRLRLDRSLCFDLRGNGSQSNTSQ